MKFSGDQSFKEYISINQSFKECILKLKFWSGSLIEWISNIGRCVQEMIEFIVVNS